MAKILGSRVEKGALDEVCKQLRADWKVHREMLKRDLEIVSACVHSRAENAALQKAQAHESNAARPASCVKAEIIVNFPI